MNKYADQKNLTCSIVGARGYSGLELTRLLLKHPKVDLKSCFATSAFNLSDYLPLQGISSIQCLPDSELFNNLTDIVFLATPAEVSLELTHKLRQLGKTVIDVSGAFRLKKHSYTEWYGFSHTDEKNLKASFYGLVPFASADNKDIQLIANPGCYATAISMALIPLIKHNVINEQSIVVDAKSGTSGAGKKPTENMLFTEVDGECLPYKVGRHQHYPEIVEAIELYAHKKIDFHFTTSLLPTRRGIIAGIYARLSEGKTIDDVHACFDNEFKNYPLVSHQLISKQPSLLSLKKVVGTGQTHISYEVRDNKLYVFSTIDNLLKGAASQAVENMNHILGLTPYTGLDHLEVLT